MKFEGLGRLKMQINVGKALTFPISTFVI
jgi:hypothetical protein